MPIKHTIMIDPCSENAFWTINKINKTVFKLTIFKFAVCKVRNQNFHTSPL